MSESAIRDAKLVADFLGIPHVEVDLRDSFYHSIVEPFCHEYLQGRTPNPCIVCNHLIKFGALLDFVKNDIGADMVATGHYALYRLRKNLYVAQRDRSHQRPSHTFWHGLRPISWQRLFFLLAHMPNRISCLLHMSTNYRLRTVLKVRRFVLSLTTNTLNSS